MDIRSLAQALSIAPRLPTAEDLGPTASLAAQRGIASYDLSPLARGIEAKQRSVQALGSAIGSIGEGMQGVLLKEPGEFLERIKMLSPEVARELRGRIAAKRLYDPETIWERWPEVKARLLKDGEDADLTDLLPPRAKSGSRERKRALVEE